MKEEIQILLTLMRAAAVGTTITYEQFGEALGRVVKSTDHALQTAVKDLVAEKIIYGNVRTIGYQRCSPSEVAGERARKRMLKPHRASKRALKELHTVSEKDIKSSDRPAFWARQTIHQNIIRTTHGNSVRAAAKREVRTNHLEEVMTGIKNRTKRTSSE